MGNEKTKQAILEYLEEIGNIYISAKKAGVSRATFYRWQAADKKFKKQVDKAIRSGRKNMIDMALYSLFVKVKEKDMGAIKYLLSHLSPEFRKRHTDTITIMHKRAGSGCAPTRDLSLDDIVDRYNRGEDMSRYGLLHVSQAQDKSPDALPPTAGLHINAPGTPIILPPGES